MKTHIFVGLVGLLAVPALAQGKAAVPAPSGGAPAVVKLECSAGTKQIGGPKSAIEASACVKFGRDGTRIYHGPYVAYWPNGVKQAEGQYLESFRDGKWTFFDDKGVKTGETSFKAGNYDGVRVEFWPNGQKKLEESYVMGKRQGLQQTFDQTGKALSVIEFVDDRPVQK